MVRFYTSYYCEKNNKRHDEIIECLRHNIDCSAIDGIYLILERVGEPPIEHEKLETRHIDNRPTYEDFFQWAKDSSLSSSDLTVIANSDIYFDSNLVALIHALKLNQCAALSRWDLNPSVNPLLFDRNDSQDTWVFRGPLKKIRGNFHVGVPRCDNRILYELQQAGYKVINPAFSVRTYHLHEGVRGEYQNDNLDHFIEPPYAYLWPHNLWSLPRTAFYNMRHPDARLSWRFDQRKFSQSLPVRVVKKVITVFTRNLSD